MRYSLKKYVRIFRAGLREATFYRLDTIMGFLTSVFFLLLAYYIWSAIAASGTLNSSLKAILTYIFVGQIVWNTVRTNVEEEIGERIRKGTIVNELKRPISLRLQIYFYLLAEMVYNFITRGIPVFLLGTFFIGLQLPNLLNLGGFLISIFLSFNLIFALSYLTSMFIFWTKVDWSIRMMRGSVQRVLSGALFPLYLLPEYLKPVFFSTPFPSMVDTPINIFRMETTGNELLGVFGEQLAWILILFLIGEILWRKARTKLTVQGG